jgi:DHA2 family multidrug resistance protein
MGFTISSLFCGVATTLETEVLFRALQGVFGAPLVAVSQAIILDTYPPEEHAKALSLWGLGLLVGPILGPTLGGWLTEYYSWRWVFYINLPIGMLAFLGTLAFVPETPIDRSLKLDWTGFLSLSIGLAAMQLLLDRGELVDWFDSREIVIYGIIAGLCFYIFVTHTLTARRRTFLNLELFNDRNYTVGLVFIFLFGVMIMGPLILLPLMLEELGGYPVIDIGLLLASRGIGAMFGMIAAGRITARGGHRTLMGIGLLTLAFGTGPMIFWTADVAEFDIVWTGAVHGLGMGLFYVPLATITYSTLEARFRTEGAAWFQFLRNLGASVCVSVLVTYLSRYTTVNRTEMIANVNPFNDVLRNPAVLPYWDIFQAKGLAALDRVVGQEALMIAYTNDFVLITAAPLITLPFLLLFRAAPSRG